jgi:hypothetical protein
MFEDDGGFFLQYLVFVVYALDLCPGKGSRSLELADPAFQTFGHWVSALQFGLRLLITKVRAAFSRHLSKQNIHVIKALLKWW